MLPEATSGEESGRSDGQSVDAAAPVTSLRWQHRYGTMLIETFADGSVRINGEPVRDTLPAGATMPAKDPGT